MVRPVGNKGNHMHRLGKAILIAGALIVSVVALAVLLFVIPATRSIVLGLAFRLLVWERGYHYASGVATFANQTLTITNLRIDDDRREEFFAAKRLVVGIEPAGLIGRSDRLFGLHSVEVDEPRFALRHRSDASWNFAGLLPHGGGALRPAAKPLRVHIEVIHGEIDVIDPQAANEAGKSFALAGIESVVDFDKLTQSRGGLSALLATKVGKAPLRATLFENDRVSFARATLVGDAVPIAPIFDAFVPSPAFIVQGGMATIRMQAYAIGYGPGEAQQWHLGADARVRDGQVHVTPLIVPIRDLVCDLHFQDGLLSVGRARGFTAGIPLRAQGAVQLFGGTRLMIEARQQGHLEQAKRLLAFTSTKDLEGQVDVAIRVDGPLADIGVSGVVRLGNARYAIAHFPSVRGSFYYRQGHVTASALDVASGGAKFWSQADFDLSFCACQHARHRCGGRASGNDSGRCKRDSKWCRARDRVLRWPRRALERGRLCASHRTCGDFDPHILRWRSAKRFAWPAALPSRRWRWICLGAAHVWSAQRMVRRAHRISPAPPYP